jgi:hypothetical protein
MLHENENENENENGIRPQTRTKAGGERKKHQVVVERE